MSGAARPQRQAVPSRSDRRRGGGLYALLICFLVIVLDGFNTMSISFVVPALAREWHLAPAQFTGVFVATNVGAALGFALVGPLARRFGRRPVGIAAVLLFGGGTLLATWASSVAALACLRVVAALGLGAALPIAITASADLIGAKQKVVAALFVTTGMSVGTVTGGLTGGRLIEHFGWPAVFVVGGTLPLLLVPLFARVLASGDGAESGAAAAAGAPNPLASLFRDGLAIYTCLLWLFAFLVFLDVYAMMFWMPTLLPAFGFSMAGAPVGMAAFSMGGLAGNLVMTLSALAGAGARIARVHFLLVAGLALVVAGVLLLSQAAVSQAAVLLLVGVVGAGLVNGIMGQNALSMVFYPPSMRATGIGWCHAVGRLGSFIGPAIGGALLALGWPFRDILLAAAVPALAAIAVLLALAVIDRSRRRLLAGDADTDTGAGR